MPMKFPKEILKSAFGEMSGWILEESFDKNKILIELLFSNSLIPVLSSFSLVPELSLFGV